MGKRKIWFLWLGKVLFLLSNLTFGTGFDYSDLPGIECPEETRLCIYYGHCCRLEDQICSSEHRDCENIFLQGEDRLEICCQSLFEKNWDRDGLRDACYFNFGKQTLEGACTEKKAGEPGDSCTVSCKDNLICLKPNNTCGCTDSQYFDHTSQLCLPEPHSPSAEEPPQRYTHLPLEPIGRSANPEGCSCSSHCITLGLIVLLILLVAVFGLLIVYLLWRRKTRKQTGGTEDSTAREKNGHTDADVEKGSVDASAKKSELDIEGNSESARVVISPERKKEEREQKDADADAAEEGTLERDVTGDVVDVRSKDGLPKCTASNEA